MTLKKKISQYITKSFPINKDLYLAMVAIGFSGGTAFVRQFLSGAQVLPLLMQFLHVALNTDSTQLHYLHRRGVSWGLGVS